MGVIFYLHYMSQHPAQADVAPWWASLVLATAGAAASWWAARTQMEQHARTA